MRLTIVGQPMRYDKQVTNPHTISYHGARLNRQIGAKPNRPLPPKLLSTAKIETTHTKKKKNVDRRNPHWTSVVVILVLLCSVSASRSSILWRIVSSLPPIIPVPSTTPGLARSCVRPPVGSTVVGRLSSGVASLEPRAPFCFGGRGSQKNVGTRMNSKAYFGVGE